MNTVRRFVLLLSLLSLAAGAASAALTWTSREFSGETKPLQRTLDVAFAFKNTGNQPVSVLDVQTNCDCTVAAADKKIYQPGEPGLITARFSVGDRVGVYQRSITVVTDDGSPPQRLQLQISVPELAAITPRVLDWTAGAAGEEKPVDVTVTNGIRISFATLYVSSESFRARFETLEAGRRYRIFVRPVSTAEPASVAIRLKGQAESGEDVVVSAYANVR